MCKAIEFKDLKFRSGEKSDYADLALSEEVLWEVKPNDYSDKVNILVQVSCTVLSKSYNKTNASFAQSNIIAPIRRSQQLYNQDQKWQSCRRMYDGHATHPTHSFLCGRPGDSQERLCYVTVRFTAVSL
jgi:hypothetical protein